LFVLLSFNHLFILETEMKRSKDNDAADIDSQLKRPTLSTTQDRIHLFLSCMIFIPTFGSYLFLLL